jgi:hypothetical protein
METTNTTVTYTLSLTLDQINVLIAGVGELPTKIGMPVTEEIRKQIIPQLPNTTER